MTRAGIIVLLVVLAVPAVAQTPPGPSDTTVLHLTERAERNVPRDTLRAELGAEAENADAAKLQADINRLTTAAVARAKSTPGIAVETTGYSVYQERPDKAPALWHGSQTIALTGKDFAALLALVGALQQDGLVVTSLSPELSKEAQRAVEDELTDTALARLQQRAARVAASLGMRVEGYRDLQLGNATTQASPQPRVLTMIAGAQAAPPVAEPGEAAVSVTAEAQIALAPK